MAGVNIVAILQGRGPAVTDLVGGQVQDHVRSASSVAPLFKSGKIEGLGVTSAQPPRSFRIGLP